MRKGVKERRELGRHKVCLNCKVEFCSIVPNGYRTPKEVSCSKLCSNEYAVKKRYENGTYIRTKESIEKDFANQFKYDGKEKVVVLNPGKKKRYAEHTEELNLE